MAQFSFCTNFYNDVDFPIPESPYNLIPSGNFSKIKINFAT